MRRDETLLQYGTFAARAECVKGYKTHTKRRLPTCIVGGQSKTVVQPQHCTQANYIFTVSPQPHCLLERTSISLPFSTQTQGMVDSNAAVRTPMRADTKKKRHSARTLGCCTQGRTHRNVSTNSNDKHF